MGLQDIDFTAFREPRGFIKVLQWVFAICAFATTCNFSTYVSFQVKCNTSVTNSTITISETVTYPFRLDNKLQEYTTCDNKTDNIAFPIDVHSDAEFFVTTGVLSFLYATALIIVYLYADKTYLENTKLPIADFIGTLVLAVFWLSGSAAWANGLSEAKKGANAENWMLQPGYNICTKDAICSNVNAGNFNGIVISILFGFINFVLWSGNLWYIYKETTFFESIMKNAATTNSANNAGA